MQQDKRGRGSTDDTFGAILLPESKIREIKKVQHNKKMGGGAEKKCSKLEEEKNNKQ